jgi:predicted HD phosphohydrolase
VRSLELQGGIFTPAEAEGFRLRPYAEDAIRLRRWDDCAKDPAVQTRPLAEYAELLRHLARR